MRKVLFGLVASVLLAVGTVAPASAEQLSASAGCQYRVNETLVGVFETPSTSSFLLKNKGYGAIVTGANGTCDWTYYNASENREYLAVDIDIAVDGVGWMRRAALVKL